VKVRHHGRAASEANQAQAPGQALAKEKIVAVMEHRGCEELALAGLALPRQLRGKAFLARLARRVLHRAAGDAFLQLEAPERSGRGETQRDAASRRRRQRRQPRAQDRIFSFELHEARIAAPLPRPRS
jgi:hypothetical protein